MNMTPPPLRLMLTGRPGRRHPRKCMVLTGTDWKTADHWCPNHATHHVTVNQQHGDRQTPTTTQVCTDHHTQARTMPGFVASAPIGGHS